MLNCEMLLLLCNIKCQALNVYRQWRQERAIRLKDQIVCNGIRYQVEVLTSSRIYQTADVYRQVTTKEGRWHQGETWGPGPSAGPGGAWPRGRERGGGILNLVRDEFSKYKENLKLRETPKS